MDKIKTNTWVIITKMITTVIVTTILLGSTIWSSISWNTLISSFDNPENNQIVVNLATFYCASMIILSGCVLYILLYELIKRSSLPKRKLQTIIYVLMFGVAIMVFLPKYAGKYYINQAEQKGYKFDQENSYQWLFYRRLVFTKQKCN